MAPSTHARLTKPVLLRCRPTGLSAEVALEAVHGRLLLAHSSNIAPRQPLEDSSIPGSSKRLNFIGILLVVCVTLERMHTSYVQYPCVLWRQCDGAALVAQQQELAPGFPMPPGFPLFDGLRRRRWQELAAATLMDHAAALSVLAALQVPAALMKQLFVATQRAQTDSSILQGAQYSSIQLNTGLPCDV